MIAGTMHDRLHQRRRRRRRSAQCTRPAPAAHPVVRAAARQAAPSGPPVIWKCLEVTCSSDDDGAEPITLTDIASFRPTPGRPAHAARRVDGARARRQLLRGDRASTWSTGTLLGQPASVRFTPVAFHWNYGDGKAATRSTKGATWEALGIPEFGRTPTSHVYERGGAVHDPPHDRLRRRVPVRGQPVLSDRRVFCPFRPTICTSPSTARRPCSSSTTARRTPAARDAESGCPKK